MVSQAISSLAILKVNWDTLHRDYIENFVPFVAQCILLLKPSVVSVSDLQSKMLDEFGLQVPQNALKVILKRSAKRGYCRREEQMYVPNYDALNRLDFESTRQRVLREHSALIGKLIQFASEKYASQLQEEEAERVLLAYVTQRDVELISCLVSGTPILETKTIPSRDYYLLNTFVRHLYESDPEGFNYLDTVVKGHMLANVLIFPDLTRVQRRFHRTAVYCDTALILRALGYEGSASQAPCKELIDLLYQLGAEIRCFRHTHDEISSILYACMWALDLRRGEIGSGRTFHYLSDTGYKQSDVELELKKLSRRIEAMGIKIVDKPEHPEHLQIDEGDLDKVLQADVKYGIERDRARLHDVDCLSAIYRLRKGRDRYDIEDCGALFVTCNSTLCQSSQGFFHKQDYMAEGTVPLAITDYTLTTILWLKRPMSAPNLPLKYIVAQSYAAMNPGDHLWRKYLTEISSLKDRGDISSDDYYLLRAAPLARVGLMDLTMGDEDAFVEGTPYEILERVKQTIKTEEVARLEEEGRRRAEVECELQFERTRSKEREESQIQKINGLSRAWARRLSKAPFVILMVLLLFGAYASFPESLPTFRLFWLNYLPPIGFAILIVVGILNLIFGFTLRDYLNRFEVFLATKIEEKLMSWFLP